jgi:hypothetical protein
MTNLEKAEAIFHECAPLIEQINQHPLYQSIHSLHDLRIFMEHHVFAPSKPAALLRRTPLGTVHESWPFTRLEPF